MDRAIGGGLNVLPQSPSGEAQPVPANSPVANFQRGAHSGHFEVKAKNAKSFGNSVADGTYDT